MCREEAFAAYSATEGAVRGLVAAGRAVFAAEVDDLQMQGVPALLGKEALTVFFGLLDVFAIGQTPAVDQPMDMGVDGKSSYAEVLRQDDLGSFMADTGQSF